jgi:cytosine/adenosine deaminase-related metal-dependent hydrolase
MYIWEERRWRRSRNAWRWARLCFWRGAAWFAGDEAKRGTLEAGKWADLVVLDHDCMTVPVERISQIKPLLTVVGGHVRHASGPFADMAPKPSQR